MCRGRGQSGVQCEVAGIVGRGMGDPGQIVI
jgi:hypothetical protein